MTLYVKNGNIIEPPLDFWRRDSKMLRVAHMGIVYAFASVGQRIPQEDAAFYVRMLRALGQHNERVKPLPMPCQCFIAGVRSAACSFVPVKPFSWVREA